MKGSNLRTVNMVISMLGKTVKTLSRKTKSTVDKAKMKVTAEN